MWTITPAAGKVIYSLGFSWKYNIINGFDNDVFWWFWPTELVWDPQCRRGRCGLIKIEYTSRWTALTTCVLKCVLNVSCDQLWTDLTSLLSKLNIMTVICAHKDQIHVFFYVWVRVLASERDNCMDTEKRKNAFDSFWNCSGSKGR